VWGGTDLNLGVEDRAPFLYRLGHLARQLHLTLAHMPSALDSTHTLYCAATASDVHLTFASSASSPNAARAEPFESAWARAHRACPAVYAFFDCATSDTIDGGPGDDIASERTAGRRPGPDCFPTPRGCSSYLAVRHHHVRRKIAATEYGQQGW
jgi:hypothetical protein